MRIGEVSERVGIKAKTVRYWEERGLLPPPDRTRAGYREYDEGIVERLEFIRYAQAGGLTLDQIRQVLDIGDRGDPPCEHVARVVTDRLAEVDSRIADLTATRRHLQDLARRAAAQDPADCRGYCSIITG